LSTPTISVIDAYSFGRLFGGSSALELLSDYRSFLDFLHVRNLSEDRSKNLLLGLRLLLNTVVNEQKFVLETESPFFLEADSMTRRALHEGCPMKQVPSNSDLAQVLRGLDLRVTASLETQTCLNFFEANRQGFGVYVSVLKDIRESNLILCGLANSMSKELALSFCSMEFLADLTDMKMLKIPLKSGGTDFAIGKRTAAFKRGGLFERMFEGYIAGVSYLWQRLAAPAMVSNPWTDVLCCKDWGDFLELYDKMIQDRISETEEHYGLVASKDIAVEFDNPAGGALAPIFEPYHPHARASRAQQLDAEFLWYDLQVLDGGDSVLYPGVPTFVYLLEGLAGMYASGRIQGPVQVRRIMHPLTGSPTAADISYAILVPSFGSLWSDSSGWIVHLYCCNNCTGGARSLMRLAEETIQRLGELIEVRELSVSRQEFERYLKERIEKKSKSVACSLTRSELATFIMDVSDELSAAFIELFVATSMAEDGYHVKWRYRNKKQIRNQEIDVLTWKDDLVYVIECAKSLPKSSKEIQKLVEELKAKKESVEKRIFPGLRVRSRIVVAENLDDEELQQSIQTLRQSDVDIQDIYALMNHSKHGTTQLRNFLLRIQVAKRNRGSLFLAEIMRMSDARDVEP